MPEPRLDREDRDKCGIAERGFVVAGCEASGFLQFVEATRDDVAKSIDGGIDRKLLFPVSPGGIMAKPPRVHVPRDEVSIIIHISKQNLCWRAFFIHERTIAFKVGDFATRG